MNNIIILSYIYLLQNSSSISFWQCLSLYYATIGFYLNHLILYISIWFSLISEILLIILEKYMIHENIDIFIAEHVFTFQIGLLLVTPGIFELILENGFLYGLWKYFSHFFILLIYSTFHILNTSSYWQYGLLHSAFYLPSGRGTGLEHYFMLDMYNNFYKTHWKTGFFIFWMGIFVIILTGNIWIFLFMYFFPSSIWLWGSMFLNPGSLPSNVHEKQWKRLINTDMEQIKIIIKKHSSIDTYRPKIQGNVIKKLLCNFFRKIGNIGRIFHWIYTLINFSILIRFLRFFGLLTIVWLYIFPEKIPIPIFTDERRRILRWEEDDSRTKSIFFNTIAKEQKKEEKENQVIFYF